MFCDFCKEEVQGEPTHYVEGRVIYTCPNCLCLIVGDK